MAAGSLSNTMPAAVPPPSATHAGVALAGLLAFLLAAVVPAGGASFWRRYRAFGTFYDQPHGERHVPARPAAGNSYRGPVGAQLQQATFSVTCLVAGAIRGASIIGLPGGWSVMLKLGLSEKPLGTQRTDKPRLWRSLDSCMEYLKNNLRIVRELVISRTPFIVVFRVKARAARIEMLRVLHSSRRYP